MTPRPTLSPSSPLVQALAGGMALAVAMGIGRFAFTPILPMMLEDAGLSLGQGGWLASANYAGYLAGALSASMLNLATGLAIRTGLMMIALTTLAMALPMAVEGWMALRFLAGVASAWMLIAVSAWSVGASVQTGRPELSGITFAGVGTGILLAGLSCLVLIRLEAASSQAWLLLGLLSAGAGILVRPVLQASCPLTPGRRRASPKIRWRPASIVLTACYGLFGFGYIIPATYLPVLAKASLEDAALFGWAWPAFGLAAAASTLVVVRLRRLVSSRSLLAGACLVMAVGIAMPAFRLNLASIALAALCVGGTFMVITLAAMQEARRIGGDGAPTLMAAMTAAFASGQILGPLTVDGAAGQTDFSAALLLAAFLLVVSAVGLSFMPSEKNPDSAR